MNYKIRTGGLALTAFYAVLFSGSLHIVVALFVYVMSDLKHIFRADAHADLAALAKLFINIYRHGSFLSFFYAGGGPKGPITPAVFDLFKQGPDRLHHLHRIFHHMDTGVLKGSDLCLCCSHIAAHNGSRMAQALALRGVASHDQ